MSSRVRPQAPQAVAGLREAILTVLHVRGIDCPDESRARLLACEDPAALQRWLIRAKTAGAAAEVFFEEKSDAGER